MQQYWELGIIVHVKTPFSIRATLTSPLGPASSSHQDNTVLKLCGKHQGRIGVCSRAALGPWAVVWETPAL